MLRVKIIGLWSFPLDTLESWILFTKFDAIVQMFFSIAREIKFVVLPVLAVILFACSGSDAVGPDLELEVTTTGKVSGRTPINEPPVNALSTPDLVELLKPSVVQIAVNFDRGRGVGTGVVLDSTGLILTNWHVVEDAKMITVAFDDGSIVEGEFFRRDPQLDLAIVRVDHSGLQPANFGDSEQLKIGEDVVAIGHALGLRGGPTVSKGVVSALDRTLVGHPRGDLTGLIQTDAAINEGNSGGPLVNMFGEVVGINTAKINIGDRIGFAINMNAAKAAAYSLIAQGPVPPPGFLGVGGIDVTRALAWAIGLPVGEGFGVTSIEPGSPAEEAGIELDDIIVQMNETVITDGQDLTEFLGEHPSGSNIKIMVVRDARLLVSLQGELSDEPER